MVIFGAGFWGWQMSGHTIRGLGPVSVPPLYESVVAAAPKRRVPSARVSLSWTVRRLRHGRAVRAIWKPDVNGPARRRTNDQTPGLEPGDRHSLPNQTGRPRQWERPSSNRAAYRLMSYPVRQLSKLQVCRWIPRQLCDPDSCVSSVSVRGCPVEHSNSGKKSFDSIRFGNLINLPFVHWYSNSMLGVIFYSMHCVTAFVDVLHSIAFNCVDYGVF